PAPKGRRPAGRTSRPLGRGSPQATPKAGGSPNEVGRRAKGIAPFSPDGLAPGRHGASGTTSYINFRMVETEDPVNPDKKIKRLVLDIQVTTL
ncbi:MAG: hypothetical protein QME51_00995, partial [Planctomycetota bacterium]|nr:hypothetical protein [Planctomycetota bacterium]MDI6786935.1 hypothetical protein [Planctomycetota bacterium]